MMENAKCSKCGTEISSESKFCPSCGNPAPGTRPKSKKTCLGCGIAVVIFIILVAIIGSFGSKDKQDARDPITHQQAGTQDSQADTDSSTPDGNESQASGSGTEVFKQGDEVRVGNATYVVTRSWWSSSLSSNQFLNQPPDAKYLFIELSLRNNGNEPMSTPPFRLVDENGAEYETSSQGYLIENSLSEMLDRINPNVTKQGRILFDVPPDRSYKLKVTGGLLWGDSELIELSPE